ncbi:MAG: LacI family transcriptional regulator [Actinomycetota bacterium]|nr:LacI family transcriptional regulator [Actinomycetota bacterium]
MKRKPTIEDVARAAQVSKGAVSFALNGRPGVSAVTRKRILAAASELGWSPSSSARALSTSKSSAVGLVMARSPELLGADPFFAPFIAGVESVLAERGHALVLQVVREGEAELAGYRRLAASERVDGVFLTDLRVDDPRPGLLSQLDLAAVMVGRPREPAPHPSVVLDDRAGITAAVRHLLDLGHRHIAHVAGPEYFVHGADRRQAWSDALTGAGLVPGPCVVSDFTAAGGAAATVELLARAERPTAIVYANDLMAMAGLPVLAAGGLSVPDDISITGFDDTELVAHLAPPLTTVATNVLGWGAAAAESLLAVIGGSEPADVVLPPATLVVRRSTGLATLPAR